MRTTAWALLALAALAGCAPAQPFFSPVSTELPPGWSLRPLPGADMGRTVQVLEREARAPPARYRLVVLPGSGCTGFAPFAARYFASALHARVQVLHKPGASVHAGATPQRCPPAFDTSDRLDVWQADARAALQALGSESETGAPLPLVLVGISEGAELLPALAAQAPHLAGLVLVSASGLDPVEAGALQADRLGASGRWQGLGERVAGSEADTQQIEGRSLAAWRVLWRWRMSDALIDGPWPFLQVFGTADALVPPSAYARFAERARDRSAPWCARALPGADHGLQGPAGDGVQALWRWLEDAARTPQPGSCLPLGR